MVSWAEIWRFKSRFSGESFSAISRLEGHSRSLPGRSGWKAKVLVVVVVVGPGAASWATSWAAVARWHFLIEGNFAGDCGAWPRSPKEGQNRFRCPSAIEDHDHPVPLLPLPLLCSRGCLASLISCSLIFLHGRVDG